MNCDGCHGGGAVGWVGAEPGRRPLALRRRATRAVFQSIFYGRPRGMPAFGGLLPAESIWKLVAYLRSLEPAVDTLSTTAW